LTEQAIVAAQDDGQPLADIPDNDPFAGPAFDADVDTMLALQRACVLSRLDELPHKGFSLEDSYEEGWFDLDQLDGLIVALESLLNEARAAATRPAMPLGDPRVSRWLEDALAFSHTAKRLKRGVCFWL
jgi:hypothetical protein